MMDGRVTTQPGYAGIVQSLARQALSAACDAAPHRAREGERRWSMAQALPAARILIGAGDGGDSAKLIDAADQLKQTLAEASGKVTDGFGHARPIYRWLALHLVGSAAKLAGNAQAFVQVGTAARLSLVASDAAQPADACLAVWRNLIAWQHGLPDAACDVLGAFEQSDEPAPLVVLGLNDLIDAWTYNELVGMHGLHLHAVLRDDAQAAARVQLAALYHLGHTQPDYTTYQPWALSAFASDAQTAVFAEQQLHDVATHLSIEGPGGAVLPALLLADASSVMTDGLARAWHDR